MVVVMVMVGGGGGGIRGDDNGNSVSDIDALQ